MPLDPDQRTRLLAAKARGLVADATNVDASELRVTPFPGGALVRASSAAWCLLDDGAVRSLGPAMVLADREGFNTLNVMAESLETSGIVARRAEQFHNGPTVWRIEGRSLIPAIPATVTSTPASISMPMSSRAAADGSTGTGTVAGIAGMSERPSIRHTVGPL